MVQEESIMETPFQIRLRKRHAVVESFRASGMTRKAFCHRNKIALSTLDWWLRKVKNERADNVSRSNHGKALPLFIPIAPARSDATGNAVELYFHDGRHLLLPTAMGIDNVIRIIRDCGVGV